MVIVPVAGVILASLFGILLLFGVLEPMYIVGRFFDASFKDALSSFVKSSAAGVALLVVLIKFKSEEELAVIKDFVSTAVFKVDV